VAVELAESAVHAADYQLAEYTLHRNQLGQFGSIRRDGDQICFELIDERGRRSRCEPAGDDLVVGPTMIGHLAGRLEQLRAGERVHIRMGLVDRLGSIPFVVDAAAAGAEQTRLRMRPAALWLRPFIRPIHITYDAAGKLVRLEGRVPPKVRRGRAWRAFDARVEYAYVAPAYR
jgi:hypothetical protein